ncbi:hypothetical protein NHX12_027676 [Muraenolepis orangiensis]|uniref:Ig-like domain-containing protein n=1 Tax=Muraenolepis orangiensis TaxID=630683 RepID=A0A9Q0EF02_9TELE|nr:hypothetical protein NHX12_027676 [Muraenolepis orangiensis]
MVGSRAGPLSRPFQVGPSLGLDDLLEMDRRLQAARAEKERLLRERKVQRRRRLTGDTHQSDQDEVSARVRNLPFFLALIFDLRAHMESLGHGVSGCPGLRMTSRRCAGFLTKQGERQPTPALSVSSDTETLQRKAKESGEMMTMLREQLPPSEQVTERTTYVAYVKSVLLGLSVKDFRRARKGFNKVLRPFCESDSTDDDKAESEPERVPVTARRLAATSHNASAAAGDLHLTLAPSEDLDWKTVVCRGLHPLLTSSCNVTARQPVEFLPRVGVGLGLDGRIAVTMACVSHAVPDAVVTWLREGGQAVTSGNRHQISANTTLLTV